MKHWTAYGLRRDVKVHPQKITFQFYKNKNVFELFFARLKKFASVEICYSKLQSTFLAAIQLVSAIT
ncbi:MAG: transposase [Acetobacter sp.]|nr:transposase [Acetobacter sp.]